MSHLKVTHRFGLHMKNTADSIMEGWFYEALQHSAIHLFFSLSECHMVSWHWVRVQCIREHWQKSCGRALKVKWVISAPLFKNRLSDLRLPLFGKTDKIYISVWANIVLWPSQVHQITDSAALMQKWYTSLLRSSWSSWFLKHNC